MALINANLTETRTQIAVDQMKEMLSWEKLSDGRMLLRVNSSSLDIMQQCWRKTFMALYQGYRNNLEGAALTFGSAIHAAMQVFYESPLESRELPKDFNKNMDLIGGQCPPDGLISSHLYYRAAQAFVDRAQSLNNLPPGNKRSVANGVWILSHYFKTYKDDPYTTLCDEHGPVVERHFRHKLCEDSNVVVELHGQIDLGLKHIVTGKHLVADHKTTSQAGKDFFNRLKPNHQYTGYLLGARHVLGIDTDSFMVNALQVKQKPVTARGGPPALPRQDTKRTEEDFKEFRQLMLYYSNEFVRFMQDWGDTPWPLNGPNSCAMYGGCTFHDVCSSPGVVREGILKSRFMSGEERMRLIAEKGAE